MIHRAVIVGLLLCAGGWAAPAQEDLLANPGFEAGNQAPDGWTINHRGTNGQIAWDNRRAASGRRSVRLTNQAGQSGNVLQTVKFDPPLPTGSLVEYGASSATEGVGGGAPSIVLYLQPPAGDRQNANSPGIAGTHDFAPVSAAVTTDRTVASIVIYLTHYGTGTAWWDDAWLRVSRAEPVTVLPRPAATGQTFPLSTADGLTLTLNDAGGFAQVRVGASDLRRKDLPSGLWVRPWKGDLAPVAGTLMSSGEGVVQMCRPSCERLSVICRWSAEADLIRCTGSILDRTDQERAVDLIVSLPVGAAGGAGGWRWGQSVIKELPLTSVVLNDLTFSALSGPDGGLSLAVPADSPSDCHFGWSPSLGYYIRFRFGLSPEGAGELKSRAPFSFTISRIDPNWGLRDAARRYQAANPAAFEKRATHEGLWLFGRPRIDLPDPENYAFHEGGPVGWEYDDAHGIATCPYIIPGQREITHLDSLPTSAADALKFFQAWQAPADAKRTERGWDDKEIIEDCMLYDANGDPEVVIRQTDWGGNSVTFPLNANPQLFEGTDRASVGRTLLDYTGSLHDQIPSLDGIYVDSLGAWGNYDNFRGEHFPFARVPLSYDGNTGRPIIPNRFTLLEFLWGLGDVLHPRGKLVFANGVHPDRRFHAYSLDVLGVEGRGQFEQKRTIAGSKPFLLLIYNIQTRPAEMADWYNRCTHWGLYPSFGNMSVFKTSQSYAPVAELNNRYVPALRTITGAGWQPVTNVRASDGVLVERWGPGKDGVVYLTVLSESATKATLTIDTGALGLGASLTARDLLTGEQFTAQEASGRARLSFRLNATRVRVLRLQGR